MVAEPIDLLPALSNDELRVMLARAYIAKANAEDNIALLEKLLATGDGLAPVSG